MDRARVNDLLSAKAKRPTEWGRRSHMRPQAQATRPRAMGRARVNQQSGQAQDRSLASRRCAGCGMSSTQNFSLQPLEFSLSANLLLTFTYERHRTNI